MDMITASHYYNCVRSVKIGQIAAFLLLYLFRRSQKVDEYLRQLFDNSKM